MYRIKQLRNYKKTIGSSEDPSLVNNVDDLGLVYQGLNAEVVLLYLTSNTNIKTDAEHCLCQTGILKRNLQMKGL